MKYIVKFLKNNIIIIITLIMFACVSWVLVEFIQLRHQLPLSIFTKFVILMILLVLEAIYAFILFGKWYIEFKDKE